MNRLTTRICEISGFKGCRAGFTLTEVVVAALIVTLAVGGLMASFVTAVNTNRFAANYYNAACLARNRIQEARTQNYEDLRALNELKRPVTKDGEEPMAGSPEALYPLYKRETIVTNSMRDCFEITVKVYYQIKHGVFTDVPVQMKTLISGQIDD